MATNAKKVAPKSVVHISTVVNRMEVGSRDRELTRPVTGRVDHRGALPPRWWQWMRWARFGVGDTCWWYVPSDRFVPPRSASGSRSALARLLAASTGPRPSAD